MSIGTTMVLTETIPEYLAASRGIEFSRRRSLQDIANRLGGGGKKPLSRLIWAGRMKHMRRFDQDYSFDRDQNGLSRMSFCGNEVLGSKPIHELIGRIDRPVTLVTTGPSALEHDWQALKRSGRMIVGVTGGAAFLKERGIVPELLILSDPDFSKTGGFHIRDAIGIPLVMEYRSAVSMHAWFPDALKNRDVSLIERVNKWYAIPALSAMELAQMNSRSGSPFSISERHDKLGRIGWSDRVDWGFFPSSTVAFVALQILVGLGAADVEIIGMDLGGNHSIYANSRPSKLHEQYEDIILPSFQIMSQALKGRNIRINNRSPVCPLPPSIFQFSN